MSVVISPRHLPARLGLTLPQHPCVSFLALQVQFQEVTPEGLFIQDGACFVEFPSQGIAYEALGILKGAEWGGRELRVQWGTPENVKRWRRRSAKLGQRKLGRRRAPQKAVAADPGSTMAVMNELMQPSASSE